MAEPLVDVDLDALAPPLKRVRLDGKIFKLPGDMPMPLFLRIQNYEQRIEKGEDETHLLEELQGELLGLFRVHQKDLKVLPDIGMRTLMLSLGAIYGGAEGEAQATLQENRATRRAKKRTPSPPAPRRRQTAT